MLGPSCIVLFSFKSTPPSWEYSACPITPRIWSCRKDMKMATLSRASEQHHLFFPQVHCRIGLEWPHFLSKHFCPWASRWQGHYPLLNVLLNLVCKRLFLHLWYWGLILASSLYSFSWETNLSHQPLLQTSTVLALDLNISELCSSIPNLF